MRLRPGAPSHAHEFINRAGVARKGLLVMSEIRIYAACLASYNAGKLHGRWIDATSGADTIAEEIAAMLAASPVPGAEEYAIHDHEGFEGLKIGESESPERVAELAGLIAEHGAAYVAYVGNVGEHYATEEGFRDAYHGQHASEEAFAEYLMGDDAESVPEFFRNHLDWESIARELFMGDFSSADDGDGGVYVFSCN